MIIKKSKFKRLKQMNSVKNVEKRKQKKIISYKDKWLEELGIMFIEGRTVEM